MMMKNQFNVKLQLHKKLMQKKCTLDNNTGKRITQTNKYSLEMLVFGDWQDVILHL